MIILLAHEMGHYLMCKYYRVSATLPFFIPFPTLIGTMGAFIRIRSPIRSRVALFDIGVAGPIAGFVLALAVLPFALAMSHAARFTGLVGQRVEVGYPADFSYRASTDCATRAGSQYLVAAAVGRLAASGCDCGLGWNVCDRAKSAARRTTGWRAHCFLDCASGAPIYFGANDCCDDSSGYYLWLGWLVWAILLAISSMRHPQVGDHPRVSGLPSVDRCVRAGDAGGDDDSRSVCEWFATDYNMAGSASVKCGRSCKSRHSSTQVRRSARSLGFVCQSLAASGQQPSSYISHSASTSTIIWVRGIFCLAASANISRKRLFSFSRLAAFRTKW